MMIVELIDGDDFRDRLVALGIRIPEGACPESSARLARRCALEGDVPGLAELVGELEGKREIMLPSVRRALETHLLPLVR
ncbi:hypothetical protein [Halomonas rhizosphaerae]|uniref:Uncharacterized protein n=1 Tax=Halomonas rhizosphaerae TaxID=3043296 RepID=A0ABT6V3D2_9GAMM|nr:hypothetical protein [Halomonas rhizosphaerae]MDI5892738.1 hypothetical protein [Halomonas rhizosphaerae]MDI5922205.1 hypothetical protein [Halomonas rhizosphaerae]